MGPLSPRAIVWSALALGGLLRIIGIAFGLPDIYHADEPIVVNHALAFGTGDLNPHFFHLPPLISYLVFGLFGIGYLVGWLLGQFPTPDAYLEAFLRNPTAWYLTARLVFGTLIGIWTIWLTYRLAQRTLGDRAALWASMFFACAFLAVREAHYVYVDVPLVALVLVVHLQLLELDERPTWRAALRLGAWFGAAVATKYNGAMLALPIGWVLIGRWFKGQGAEKKRWLLSAALCGLATVLAFVLLNPFAVLDWQTVIADLLQERQAMGQPGLWHHFGYSLMGGVGSVMAMVGLIGLAALMLRGTRAQRLVALFPFAYFLLLGMVSQLHERYVLLLIPFWAIGAAWVVDQVWQRKQWGKWVAGFVAAGMLVPNLARSAYLDWLLCQPDVRREAKQWIEQEIPSGAKIAIDHQRFGPHLPRSANQFRTLSAAIPAGPQAGAKQKKVEVLTRLAEQRTPTYFLYYLYPEEPIEFTLSQPTMPFDLDRLRTEGIEYVIVHGRVPPPALQPFYAQLEASATEVRTFSPYREKSARHFKKVPGTFFQARDCLPMTGAPFVDELFARRANGYPLRLYRLK